MRRFFIGTLAVLGTLNFSTAELALPEWSEADKKRLKEGKIIAGAAFFSPPAKTDGSDDSSNVGPEVGPEIEPEIIPEIQEYTLTQSDLEGYFTSNESGVVDPQGILTTQAKRDVSYLLSEHQSQSTLPIYLYILEQKQHLPETFLLDKMYQKVFQGKPAAIVFYFMNEPSRAACYVASSSTSSAPQPAVEEMLARSAGVANEKTEELDQMENFLGHVSMRLYWIEQDLLGLTPVVEDKQDAPQKKAEKKDPLAKIQTTWSEYMGGYTVLVIGGAVLVVLPLIGLFLYRKFRKYHFAEIPAGTHRLGAPQGAAAGELMSYKLKNNPPSEQKKKLKQKMEL